MKISLITTTYNEEENISEFLNSYKKQTLYADEFIITDGGSSDRTAMIIKKFIKKNPELNIKLIIEPTCSIKNTVGAIAKGRNTAIEAAKYSVIAVTDAGCILHKKWLQNITSPLKNHKIDVVSGWYKINPKNNFQEIYSELFFPLLDKIKENNFLPSSRSLAFRKKCWKKVGGYPEKTYAGEDTKFAIELKKAGYSFKFAPNALVIWKSPETIEEAQKKEFNYGYGDGYYKLFKIKYLKAFIVLIFSKIFIFMYKNKRKEYIQIKHTLILSKLWGYINGFIK